MSRHTEDVVEAAARACRRGGAYLADAFSRPVCTSAKSSRYDLVTQYDSAAERIIRRELATAFPDSVVIGEEDGASGAGDLTWYVDPIDGTHNFARGIPLFCVSVGAVLAGVPIAGCVYDPVRDELFSSDGTGIRPAQEDHQITEDRHAPPMLLTDIPTAGTADGGELELFLGVLDAADVRRIGSSALALAYVAAGRADVAANADVFPWDIAAGRVLVTAAGGRFTEFPAPRTGAPGGFVAWRAPHEELGRRVERAMAGSWGTARPGASYDPQP
ncbi:inositol monophosphatase family protein [Streptosporangium sp. NPDC000396]|uniref:inositol monophosphatase family protein n=1 Tax=Streptosporangium sp. NPDC000396 TaxID=3366185 RepID=UPI0036B9CB4D